MKKQLMIGLLSAGLVVAMLPGVTVAKDDDKSDCKKDGWIDWVTDDGSAFADQDECVAYVAEGGTLVTPVPTFESVCLSQNGAYFSPFWPEWDREFSEGCYWNGFESTLWGYVGVVEPTCSGVATSVVDADPEGSAWVGCQGN